LGERFSARILRRGSERPERAPDDVDRPPVDPAHQEDLEHQMDLVRMAVELEAAADFGAGRHGEAHRESFIAHFGELEDLLGEWNDAIERVRAAPGALWAWMERTARKRGIAEPPFAVGALIDRLSTVTTERARDGQLAVPHELTLERFADRGPAGERMGLLAEGQNVVRTPGDQPAAAERTLDQSERAIQALFAEAQRSKPAAEVGDARDALFDLKQRLLEALAHAAAQDPIGESGECPVCRAAAERESAAGEAQLDPGLPGTGSSDVDVSR
jgi:hypothetical protein